MGGEGGGLVGWVSWVGLLGWVGVGVGLGWVRSGRVGWCVWFCGTNAWSIGTTGTGSTICSTVRRCTCSCGRRGGGFCRRGASYSSLCPSSPALAVFCPRRAPYSACTLPLEWCNATARAMRMDCCSSEHRTQPPLSTSLSSAHGLPAELIHHKQRTQKGVTNLSEPLLLLNG